MKEKDPHHDAFPGHMAQMQPPGCVFRRTYLEGGDTQYNSFVILKHLSVA